MKTVALLLIQTLFAATAGAVEFYSTGGDLRYSLDELSTRSGDTAGQCDLYALVVAAVSASEANYGEQFGELAGLDAEALSLIYISATADSRNEDGYHTSEARARSLLDGAAFRLLILAPEGERVLVSRSVVSAGQITARLERHRRESPYSAACHDGGAN